VAVVESLPNVSSQHKALLVQLAEGL